ncbi:DUF6344 domain-containing protein [Streptomyces virens]|uniref:DUF6344 domain-containing protein n=1 Tax=Streptomyces virens TaxID=285572 RepID=A0ABP6PD72_9ACTN|nr:MULTISPECIES: DUF6344 domain-containing protein [Streptomyces]MBA8977290.1 hypothetical protein [Streptomyces calvus]MYS32087.1 hypothetical protein [Streptomyces sp. SID7804]
MARNKVMTLWTAVVTAFLALCTALGLITTTASAAVPQSEPVSNIDSRPTSVAETAPFLWSLLSALPPTMKQRIHAEAHGKSPSCRHRILPDPAPEPAPEGCSDDTTSTTEPQQAQAPLRN